MLVYMKLDFIFLNDLFETDSFHRKLNQLLYDTSNYIYTECPFVQITNRGCSGKFRQEVYYLLPLLPNIIVSLMLNILSHLQEGIYYK